MNHQHLESSFRRYEKLIEYALSFYPDVYVVDKQQLKDFGLPPSLITCCARCRDAIASLLSNDWKTTINVSLLRDKRKQFHISIHNDELWFGTKDSLRIHRTSLAEKVNAPKPKPEIQDLTPYRETYLPGFVILASKGLLKSPIRIHLRDQAHADTYEKNLGVAIMKDEQGWILLP